MHGEHMMSDMCTLTELAALSNEACPAGTLSSDMVWRKRNTVGTRSGNLFTLLSCSIQYVIDGKTCTTYFVALQEKYMHELAGQIYFITYKMQ